MFLHKIITVRSNAYVSKGRHSPPHEILKAKQARTSSSKANTKGDSLPLIDSPTLATNVDRRQLAGVGSRLCLKMMSSLRDEKVYCKHCSNEMLMLKDGFGGIMVGKSFRLNKWS